MRYARLIAYVLEMPWAILPEKLSQILTVLAVRAAGDEISEEEIRTAVASRPQRSAPMRDVAGVAVLPIMGVLHHRADMFRESSGGTSLERLSGQLQALVADPGVSAIVLDINSPGGAAAGVEEFAAEVSSARARKPIIAVANSVMASAAYWIGSAASEVVATPSGELGSIGVIVAHQNLARALDREGIDTTVISAGKYKAEGSLFGPLSPEAKAHLQQRVDGYYASFVRAVAQGRRVTQQAVRDGFGEGRVVAAGQAVKLGMADRIETLDQVLARLGARTRGGARTSAAYHPLPLAAQGGDEWRAQRLRLAMARARIADVCTPASRRPPRTDLQRRRERLQLAELEWRPKR